MPPLPRLNTWMSDHVSLVIFSGIIAGLMSGRFASIPNTALAAILFLELFIACFKIRFEDFTPKRILPLGVFLIARYAVLPIALFFVGNLFSPTIALTFLFLALLPAGVSSPGFAGLFGANVATTILIVLVSSVLAPLYLPFLLHSVAGQSIVFDSQRMLMTIAAIVVLPIILHLPFRRSPKISGMFVDYNTLLLLPLVWVTIAVPISRYRLDILSAPLYTLGIAAVFWCFYYLLLCVGLFYSRSQPSDYRKALGIASGIHNITLGVVLSLMYLPREVSALVVLTNISMVFMVGTLKTVLRRLSLG